MVPYSIYTPPMDITSGGIRVMWGLAGHLLAHGQVVYINQYPGDGNCIAVYPEIVKGNPFNSKYVVRYLLNKPGVMGGVSPSGEWTSGQTLFEKTDNIYVFSELFNVVNAKQDHKMFLPILDTRIWKDQKKKRTKQAVFFGKGQNKNLHPEGCILIDRGLAQDQQRLADVLNECTVLYDYDPVSAMTEIARLCGVRVVLMQDSYTLDEYRNYEPGLNGISFGEDTEVPLDVEGFRKHYKGMKVSFISKLMLFIDQTQKWTEK